MGQKCVNIGGNSSAKGYGVVFKRKIKGRGKLNKKVSREGRVVGGGDRKKPVEVVKS